MKILGQFRCSPRLISGFRLQEAAGMILAKRRGPILNFFLQ